VSAPGNTEGIAWAVGTLGILTLAVALAAARPFAKTADIGALPMPSVTGVITSRTPSPFHDGASNLLRNGSFETNSNGDGVADEWAKIPGRAVFDIDANAPYGSHAQRISVAGAPDPSRAFSAIQQLVPGIEGGSLYELAVDYRYFFNSGDQARSVGMVVYSLDQSGNFIASGTSIDWGWQPRDEWTRKEMTFVVPPTTVALLVEFRLSVNGTFWLDGALLRPTSR
jgi:hypothetical protein